MTKCAWPIDTTMRVRAFSGAQAYVMLAIGQGLRLPKDRQVPALLDELDMTCRIVDSATCQRGLV